VDSVNELRSFITEEPSLRGRFFCFAPRNKSREQQGNALLYVLLAVGLLAALTFTYVKDSRENYASQSAVQIEETLYSQINMIKSAVVECTAEYPGGGEDSTGNINGSPNPNMPYPLAPSSALNLFATYYNGTTYVSTGCTSSGSAAGCIPQESPAHDYVTDLYCIGAPLGAAGMFSGSSNQGRFLPSPPGGFNPWVYKSDTTFGGSGGVYVQISCTAATCDAASGIALTRLLAQFTSKQASISGNTFTGWILNNN
jgi:hypothetical protein